MTFGLLFGDGGGEGEGEGEGEGSGGGTGEVFESSGGDGTTAQSKTTSADVESNTGQPETGRIEIDENSASHIFRKDKGHFAEDTKDNRQLLEDITNDPNNKLGTEPDKWGNTWYGKLNEKGQQIWTTVRDGKIRNGGINDTPKKYNPETGLSAQVPPNSK